MSRSAVLIPQLLNDDSPRSWLIAKHSSTVSYMQELLNQIFRKALRIGRESFFRDYPAKLPVTGRAVLSSREFPQLAEAPNWLLHRSNIPDVCDVAKPESLKVGEIQTTNSRRCIHNRIASDVSVELSVRERTNSNTVKDDENDLSSISTRGNQLKIDAVFCLPGGRRKSTVDLLLVTLTNLDAALVEAPST